MNDERKCPHCDGDLRLYEDPLAVKMIADITAENARVVAESKQCHARNDKLVSEHLELKERIKGLCKLIGRTATYLCTAGDNDERVIFSAPMPPELLERLSIAAVAYIYPKV